MGKKHQRTVSALDESAAAEYIKFRQLHFNRVGVAAEIFVERCLAIPSD